MTRTRHLAPAVLAVLIGGAAALSPLPAAAQPRDGQRDWVESHDAMDPYDMYLRRLHQRAMEQQRLRELDAQDRTPTDRSAALEQYAREQFERGYRAGRNDERRRRAAQGSGRDGVMSPASSGGRDSERFLVIPDALPDRPGYRGVQDFALIPDYSRSLDWLLSAAQSLREAMQAMAQPPPSEGRDQAMSRAREALAGTQQAMMQLPPELRTR